MITKLCASRYIRSFEHSARKFDRAPVTLHLRPFTPPLCDPNSIYIEGPLLPLLPYRSHTRIIRHEIVTNCIHGKCISWLYAPRVVSIVVAESISLCPSLTFDWPFLLIERGNRASRTLESGRQLSPSTRNVFTDFSGLKRKKKKRDEKLLRNIFAEINGGRKREFFFLFFRACQKARSFLFDIHNSVGPQPAKPRAMKGFFKIFHWNWLKNIKDGGEEGEGWGREVENPG